MSTYVQPKEYTFLKMVGRLIIFGEILLPFAACFFIPIDNKYIRSIFHYSFTTVFCVITPLVFADDYSFKFGLYDLAVLSDPDLNT